MVSIAKIRFVVSLITVLLCSGVAVIHAQGTPAGCGSIVNGVFTQNAERQEYSVDMHTGDVLRVTGVPAGGTLQFTILVLGPTGVGISASNPSGYVKPDPFVETPVLAATGSYKLWVGNTRILYNGTIDTGASTLGGVGEYTLEIGCTLHDGRVIKPGDTASGDTGGGSVPPPAPPPPTFGFPGLPPVDFSAASPLPLSVGVGTIQPNSSEITAFNFDANADDVLQLDFSKLAGNLNLGLVILSANNEVVFQASLITSELLSTRLTLPSDGQYTIGVFRIDLLPPNDPQATAFQVTGTLNP